jgi:hypothetical protein
MFLLLIAASLLAVTEPASSPSEPRFPYSVVRAHQIKPQHHDIPVEVTEHTGLLRMAEALTLSLTISASGEVIHAEPVESGYALRLWPQIENQVYQWRYIPFDENGRPIVAHITEYVSLVPPEIVPIPHVSAPPLLPASSIAITLSRGGCFGTCPAYTVTLTNLSVIFDGGGFVVAPGHHAYSIDPDALHKLARAFIAADFYSMSSSYHASITDCPTYTLSISINGHRQQVEDYMGTYAGMPQIVRDLEDEVDSVARTGRWVKGDEGLVETLRAEHFDLHSREAQRILAEAASNGSTATVHTQVWSCPRLTLIRQRARSLRLRCGQKARKESLNARSSWKNRPRDLGSPLRFLRSVMGTHHVVLAYRTIHCQLMLGNVLCERAVG